MIIVLSRCCSAQGLVVRWFGSRSLLYPFFDHHTILPKEGIKERLMNAEIHPGVRWDEGSIRNIIVGLEE
jgi:hypothetical protein